MKLLTQVPGTASGIGSISFTRTLKGTPGRGTHDHHKSFTLESIRGSAGMHIVWDMYMLAQSMAEILDGIVVRGAMI